MTTPSTEPHTRNEWARMLASEANRRQPRSFVASDVSIIPATGTAAIFVAKLDPRGRLSIRASRHQANDAAIYSHETELLGMMFSATLVPAPERARLLTDNQWAAERIVALARMNTRTRAGHIRRFHQQAGCSHTAHMDATVDGLWARIRSGQVETMRVEGHHHRGPHTVSSLLNTICDKGAGIIARTNNPHDLPDAIERIRHVLDQYMPSAPVSWSDGGGRYCADWTPVLPGQVKSTNPAHPRIPRQVTIAGVGQPERKQHVPA